MRSLGSPSLGILFLRRLQSPCSLGLSFHQSVNCGNICFWASSGCWQKPFPMFVWLRFRFLNGECSYIQRPPIIPCHVGFSNMPLLHGSLLLCTKKGESLAQKLVWWNSHILYKLSAVMTSKYVCHTPLIGSKEGVDNIQEHEWFQKAGIIGNFLSVCTLAETSENLLKPQLLS